MRNYIVLIFSILLFAYIGFFSAKKLLIQNKINNNLNKQTEEAITIKPFDKYSIPNLSKANIVAGSFKITDNLFELSFNPALDEEIKTVTGIINIPESTGTFPIIIMIRGYVDQSLYKSGMGTSRAGVYFAENNFITIAPDFLGYAGSSSEAGNIFETRFQTYTTILSLISSLQSIKQWDQKNIFIWAHSNGGQVALTTLAITREVYPTTLWAPVSKPFPYNVLYYTDESEDGGKLIRRELAKFEDLYDTDEYSFIKYLDNINAPIQIHQGTTDDAVPATWSNNLNNLLTDLDLDITYYKYYNADHNLNPNWNTVVSRDLQFFQKLTK